jgi:hypothetical protein
MASKAQMTTMGTATPMPALAPVERPEDEAGVAVDVDVDAIEELVALPERERVGLLDLEAVVVAVAAARAAESLSASRILRSNWETNTEVIGKTVLIVWLSTMATPAVAVMYPAQFLKSAAV